MSDDIFTVLSHFEAELIALKDVVDIMNKVPAEYPRPVYLTKRIDVHTKQLDQKFQELWEVVNQT